MSDTRDEQRTYIYKRVDDGGELLLGYVAADCLIYKLGWQEGLPVGRIDAAGRVFRATAYDERELGLFTPDGRVRSHGLFEGGELGWLDPDGVVVQGGFILGEDEVGRVEGPQPQAAAAALLLLFLPEDAEESRRYRS